MLYSSVHTKKGGFVLVLLFSVLFESDLLFKKKKLSIILTSKLTLLSSLHGKHVVRVIIIAEIIIPNKPLKKIILYG